MAIRYETHCFAKGDPQEFANQTGIFARDVHAGRWWIYVIEFVEGPLKIGVTRHLRGRISTLRYERKRNGLDPSIRRVHVSEKHRGAEDNESKLLHLLGARRVHGEHVEATAAEVLSLFEDLDRDPADDGDDGSRAKAVEAVITLGVRPEQKMSANDVAELVAEARVLFGDRAADEIEQRFGKASPS